MMRLLQVQGCQVSETGGRPSRLLLERLEERILLSFLSGNVTVELASDLSSVDVGELVDVGVRIKYEGDDDGPWDVETLGIYDENFVPGRYDDDTIKEARYPFAISSQGTWYNHTFQNVRLSDWDDGGDGVELYARGQVDDNDDWNLHNPNDKSSVERVTPNVDLPVVEEHGVGWAEMIELSGRAEQGIEYLGNEGWATSAGSRVSSSEWSSPLESTTSALTFYDGNWSRDPERSVIYEGTDNFVLNGTDYNVLHIGDIAHDDQFVYAPLQLDESARPDGNADVEYIARYDTAGNRDWEWGIEPWDCDGLSGVALSGLEFYEGSLYAAEYVKSTTQGSWNEARIFKFRISDGNLLDTYHLDVPYVNGLELEEISGLPFAHISFGGSSRDEKAPVGVGDGIAGWGAVCVVPFAELETAQTSDSAISVAASLDEYAYSYRSKPHAEGLTFDGNGNLWVSRSDSVARLDTSAIAYVFPEVEVEWDGEFIADGSTVLTTTDGTDFGSVGQWETGPMRTFTVRNTGTSDLTTGNLSVPRGFVIDEPLASVIAPEESDDLTVALNTGNAGTYEGQIRFQNNDASESIFNFQIRGEVRAEGAGQLQFSSSNYEVHENVGSAGVVVERIGGGVSEVSVTYSTTRESATPAADFDTTSGTLTFSGGNSSQAFSVAIVDDSDTEGWEEFYVSLSNPSGGASLGSRTSSSITIIDNDHGGIETGDYVRVVRSLNVRENPGTDVAEIYEPDYAGYVPVGSVGLVMDGPVHVDGYTWWNVSWGGPSGDQIYGGWSAEGTAGEMWLKDVSSSDGRYGIDVSQYQNEIDWEDVAESGHDFAFVRATLGYPTSPDDQFEDESFDQNMVQAHAAGLDVGAYHLAYPELNPGVSGARQEADHFVDVAGAYFQEDYLRPVLDIESGNVDEFSTQELSDWVDAWVGTVADRTGVEPFLYVKPSAYTTNRLESLTDYDVWVASWKHDLDASPTTVPWTQDSWSFWQYGGDDGTIGRADQPDKKVGAVIPGIDHYAVDVDVFSDEKDYDHYLIDALPTLPFFSQNDPRWSDDIVGDTDATIGEIGCAMTSTAMVLSSYAVRDPSTEASTNPGLLNEWLSANEGYTPAGAIEWGKAGEYSSDSVLYESSLSWTSSDLSTDNDRWEDLNSLLDDGYRVITQVDADPSDGDLDEHWVVVTDFVGGDSTDPDNYGINDPWAYPYENRNLTHYYDAANDNTFFATRVFSCTASAPTVGSLAATPDPVTQPDPLTLTAGDVSDPDGADSVTKVRFYMDDGDGSWGAVDEVIGTDTSADEGWSVSVESDSVPVGENTYFARAYDGRVWSEPSGTAWTSGEVEGNEPPQVESAHPLPPDGAVTEEVIDRLSVRVSEDLAPATVNANGRMVWSYGGHFYLLTQGEKRWAEAEQEAQDVGGHLVTVNDAAEQQWLHTTFSGRYGRFWIGLTDEAEPRVWVWSNGESVEYTNWATGQPKWGSYAFMKDDTGEWDDGYSGWTYRAVIEFDGTDADDDLIPDGMDSYPMDPLNAWDLREAGADGEFDTADDEIYALVPDPTYRGGTEVGLLIEGGPLGDGHYRFTANSTLTDRAGGPLDGDADGTGGDAYHRVFDVTLPRAYVFEGTSNDVRAEATALPLGEDPPGAGYFAGRGLGSIQPESDPDWWRVQFSEGDLVSVAVDSPRSDLFSVTLYDSEGDQLAYESGGGPDSDAFLSHQRIESTGTHYVKLVGSHMSPGSYQMRVDVARGLHLESDDGYANDETEGADVLTLTQGGPDLQSATVAGTVMSTDDFSGPDQDMFALGSLNAGNEVELGTRLPSESTFVGWLSVLDSSGAEVSDQDGDVLDGHFVGTIPTDGQYYAQVESLWSRGGYLYWATDHEISWSAAESVAQDLGGHLAAVGDEAEQRWLHRAFGYAHMWLGLSDEDDDGTWEWSNGEEVTYTNWAEGQPGSGDYAYMRDSDGEWNDGWNDWDRRGVMEIPGGEAAGGPGPWAQYLLDVEVRDSVPSQVESAHPLPPDGAVTEDVIDRLSVRVSEDLAPATVNANGRMVWSYGGHFYLLTQGEKRWAEAEQEAQDVGGHLVTVNDAAEQQWLHTTFSGRYGRFWIGLTDEAEPRVWVWSNGESVEYTNWATGQPKWGSYAFMKDDTGEWDDGYSGWTYRAVIEFDGTDADDDLIPDGMDSYPMDPLNAWDLREAGADGEFDTADDEIYALVPDPTYRGGTEVGLLIEGGPLGDGHYRFTANSTLTDRAGGPLDGDADGTGGDAYQRIFDVSLPAGYVFEGTKNDVRQAATALPLEEDPPGGGYLLGRGLGSIQPGGDPDWWSFEVLAGDVISVAVDTRGSDMSPSVSLFDAGGDRLDYDWGDGPGYDAFISHQRIQSGGTCYMEVVDGSTGAYELRVDVAREVQLESDGGYANDNISGADVLSLTEGGPDLQVATVAGTLMAGDAGEGVDDDVFALGTLSAGNDVELGSAHPGASTFVGRLSLVDASGSEVTDEDGDSLDGHFLGTVPSHGQYFAKVESLWSPGGNLYRATDLDVTSTSWPEAEARAVDLGGHLVTIGDASEQQWVRETFSPFASLWIGLNDRDEDGTWEWGSGEAASYRNWAPGEPRGWGYVHMDEESGKWYGGHMSSTEVRGVVELSAEAPAGSSGPWAQYLLDVEVIDTIAPEIKGVDPLPADGGLSEEVIDRLSVTVSEDLAPSTVNANGRMVWSYGHHYYVLTEGSKNWTEAEQEAQDLGGHLVTVNDPAEQDWLHGTFSGRYYRVWIGLSEEADDTWAWSSGESVSYTNWAQGQPDYYDYVFMGEDTGRWGDAQSHRGYWGVVELEDADADGDLIPDGMDAYPMNPLNAWDLREAGADGEFDTTDDAIYRVVPAPTYEWGTEVGLLIEGGPLGDGHYRFTANSTLTDRAGGALDGDGDGTGGDPYQRIFDVSLPAGYVFEGTRNDVRQAATALPLEEDPPGGGYLLSRGLGSVQPDSDRDWWSFEAAAGDVVSVSVDTPGSALDSYVRLEDADGERLASDGDDGPDEDSFISHQVIEKTGTCHVYVGGSTGSYELRVDVARGVQLESDADYGNDEIGGADVLSLTEGGADLQSATVAGTLMGAGKYEHVDDDVFGLGTLNAGNEVELSTRVSPDSTLSGRLTLVDVSGTEVSDEDGAPLDSHFLGTIPSDGEYFARLESLWSPGGNLYRATDLDVACTDWSDVQTRAVEWGGHLVTVGDESEQQWLEEAFAPLARLWIGLNDQDEDGMWEWCSGETASYRNWARGEPGRGPFAYMEEDDGKWYGHAYGGGSTMRGIVELSAEAPPGGPGPWAQYLLDVEVRDVVAPTDIGLSSTRVPENEPPGTAVGSLITSDPDDSQPFTYSFVAGAGDDANSYFEISDQSVTTTEVFDYELESLYSVRIQTEDSNGNTYQKTFAISVTDCNDAPTAGEDEFSTDEDSPVTTNDVLANDADQDAGDVLEVLSLDQTGTTGLVTDNGDGTFDYDPNGKFEWLAAGGSASDSFAYTVSDGNGKTDTATVTVNVAGVNDVPSAGGDEFSTDEDTSFAAGSVLGNDTDPDVGDTLSVDLNGSKATGLVTDNGDGTFHYDPSGRFDHLRPGESTTDSFTYTLTDGNGGEATATVSVSIEGVNDVPTDVGLDAAQVEENQEAGAVVGSLSTVDADRDESFTYALAAGEGDEDNALFTLDGGVLQTAESFDYEEGHSYSIRVRSSDSAGEPVEEQFTVAVVNVIENDFSPALTAAVSDHVLDGVVEVEYSVHNLGQDVSPSFGVRVVLSRDEVIGNGDDRTAGTLDLEALAAGATATGSAELALDKSTLNAWALEDDPTGAQMPHVSTSTAWIGLVADAEGTVSETNEGNNIVQEKGLGKDDITYFPWDIDDSEVVTPTDAIFTINRLGDEGPEMDGRADFDGNGVVTPTDAIAVINRLGYEMNTDVVEVTPGAATTTSGRGEPSNTISRVPVTTAGDINDAERAHQAELELRRGRPGGMGRIGVLDDGGIREGTDEPAAPADLVASDTADLLTVQWSEAGANDRDDPLDPAWGGSDMTGTGR